MKLDHISFDPSLTPGAHNAIDVCLQLQPDERITVISDRDSLEVAAALMSEVKKTGAKSRVFVLENFCTRPCSDMPVEILADLEQSQVSIYTALARIGELKTRMQMMNVINKNKIRHGHMVNITKQIMTQGMRADFWQVDALSQQIMQKASKAHFLHAVTKSGTDIEVEFSPELKWVKTSGIISRDKWANLPGGEVFTSPYNLNGQFVVDGVVGDYLCHKYGDLKNSPLFIEIENSRITNLQCDNKELLNDFANYTRTDENSNRVGEFAIGTNLAVKDIIGNILQDEKIPGIHIAFGHPYCEHTGQQWYSSTHIDCVGRNFDFWMDGEQVMKDGKFLILEEVASVN